jgi:hypothetical protein
MSENNQADLLDFDLDALEDLPEFLTLPAGSYMLEGISLGQDQVEKLGTVVKLKAKILQTVELKNPETDKPVDDGTEYEWGWPLTIPDNERATAFSQGQLKIVTKALGNFYGVKTFKELAEKFPGTQFAAVTTVREDKKNLDDDGKPRKYSGIKMVVIE